MHGDIAASSNGDLFVSVGDAKAGLQVYGDDGAWKRNIPNAPSDLHGFVIRTEGTKEFIYGVRVGGGEILKMTLKEVYVDKRELKCACVGSDSKVPLGFVSLLENVMMVLMAIWMLTNL